MNQKIILITGTRKGIGRNLAEHYLNQNHIVFGCSREQSDLHHKHYKHYCLNITDEILVKKLFKDIKKEFGGLDILINNAGIASMNHSLFTEIKTIKNIFDTNLIGTFLFSREAAKLMKNKNVGRIINFSTVAVRLKLEGEAIYAASKAAVNTLTEVLAVEFADFGITVNAIGPTPVKTDLIKNIPQEKMNKLINRLPLKRLGEFDDILNIVDFLIKPESNFITGQIIYLGGA
jgi:3-oxoacyl-[acyl-carrier protein] reductase